MQQTCDSIVSKPSRKSRTLEFNSEHIEVKEDAETESQYEHVESVCGIEKIAEIDIETEPQVEHDEFVCEKETQDKVDLVEHIDFVIP